MPKFKQNHKYYWNAVHSNSTSNTNNKANKWNIYIYILNKNLTCNNLMLYKLIINYIKGIYIIYFSKIYIYIYIYIYKQFIRMFIVKENDLEYDIVYHI